MLSSPRLSRMDYHAPVEQWNALAMKAGYAPESTQLTSWDDSYHIYNGIGLRLSSSRVFDSKKADKKQAFRGAFSGEGCGAVDAI